MKTQTEIAYESHNKWIALVRSWGMLKTDEIDNTIEKIERNIKNNGGEIMEIDRWGKKRLAYEIKKRQYGYYVEFFFKADGSVVKVIEREYGLDENILRYLTIVLDKKALEYR